MRYLIEGCAGRSPPDKVSYRRLPDQKTKNKKNHNRPESVGDTAGFRMEDYVALTIVQRQRGVASLTFPVLVEAWRRCNAACILVIESTKVVCGELAFCEPNA